MPMNERWMTIKIPGDLKREFEKRENGFASFAQFVQYALRRELERLDIQR